MHLMKEGSSNEQAQMLSREEVLKALESLIRRMDTIDAQCKDGFPLYSPGSTDQWTVSPGGSWVGGFWSGWWWLRARVTGSISDKCKAAEICARLSSKIAADSINRCQIFWYGAALGNLWFGDISARSLVEESIAAIGASYDRKINCIPLGTGMGGGREGNQCVTIDTLASLIQLLNRGEHSVYPYISRCHADTILDTCFTKNGAFHTAAHLRAARLRATDRAGMWSRGQAWGMLGLSRAAAQWGEPYLTYAQSACHYWRQSRHNLLAPNRLDDPSGPPDPSSSVIASLAMLVLADLVPDGDEWRLYAHQQITAVTLSRYFIGFEENHGREKYKEGKAQGIFWGCCYKTNRGHDELVESAWGSFLLMAALCVLADIIEPSDC
ncbi:unsaturated chondroitin disaccharide hydrolase [Nitrosospira sp. Nsp2]|uniref:glucuronyl hydrolase n=1 Tax=Nitrosospira sp. Nsp2 TaxID=136548 RepID=UPI000D42CF5A|nr:glucuronyl hydrolase [Nitrosospira sp. Nsp2]PTR17575.1 unsaturated chondroitin disaccharide hydrolase [Nitrosospira sp. Nsp2]